MFHTKVTKEILREVLKDLYIILLSQNLKKRIVLILKASPELINRIVREYLKLPQS